MQTYQGLRYRVLTGRILYGHQSTIFASTFGDGPGGVGWSTYHKVSAFLEHPKWPSKKPSTDHQTAALIENCVRNDRVRANVNLNGTVDGTVRRFSLSTVQIRVLLAEPPFSPRAAATAPLRVHVASSLTLAPNGRREHLPQGRCTTSNCEAPAH